MRAKKVKLVHDDNGLHAQLSSKRVHVGCSIAARLIGIRKMGAFTATISSRYRPFARKLTVTEPGMRCGSRFCEICGDGNGCSITVGGRHVDLPSSITALFADGFGVYYVSVRRA